MVDGSGEIGSRDYAWEASGSCGSDVVSRLSNWIGFDDNATHFVCEGPRPLDPDKVVRNMLEN